MPRKVNKTEDEWRKELTQEQFFIIRHKGTEQPFSGEYYQHSGDGVYRCAACGFEIFDSETKYESGSGWPSFWAPIAEDRVEKQSDRSHGMVRTEALCPNCGGHLGHVFRDGPEPTGLRYCINSVSLDFKDRSEE